MAGSSQSGTEQKSASPQAELESVLPVIYLMEEDEILAADLVIQLQQANFAVQHFSGLNRLVAAFAEKIPSVVIMDIMFDEGRFAGADLISKLKAELDICPPIIFISECNDIEVRLAAANADIQRYFSKPVNTKKLVQTLINLVEFTKTEPFRILIVDDEINLLEFYETALAGAGLEVKTISNPFDSLEALEEFKPDVIVLDIYMPECSGLQIAKVIRQDERWAITPIMFLSAEPELDIQFDAIHIGAENFMVKPVTARHLISSVTAKAKMVRWNHRQKDDLEAALREGEYQLITSNQHNIVSTADISGRIMSVNDKFCEVSGYSREELIGKNHRILKSGHHPDSFYKDMWQTISSGQVWHGTICNYNKNGEEYWVESTIVPFLDEKGKPYKYVSARTDVTLVIQSEERLERSQNFANIGTWDWNIETGDLFWSDRIWPLLGYDKEVTEATYEIFMAAVHPDDRQLVSDAVTRCVENGTEYNIEHRIVWPDGSIHWLHESGNIIRNKDDKPGHMLGVVQDITIEKETEQTLITAREEAEKANRAKSRFLSSMSHELRTPLNAIMGFGQLLEIEMTSTLNESQQENVSEILKAGGHLLELINGVLDLAKIESGRIDFSIETVVLGGVIFESLQLIMPLAQKRGIELSLTLNGIDVSFEQLLQQRHAVRADRTRLRQVLLNLLSNAVKYNCENGKLSIACCQKENTQTRISITDTGEGIALEQQGQLFKAFSRLGAEQTEIEGTGIGLVITKNIVELMGGSIGVESQPGKGSTFWVELPNEILPSGQESAPDKNEITSTSLQRSNPEHERAVLYIEDNPSNLRLVTQLLERLDNIHMWTAHEPMLGLDLATEYKPDLILLDINLPGMDGFGVLKHLRQREATRHIPVIAISANATLKDIEKGLKAGFDDYITKPIAVKEFLQAVDKALDEGK